MVVFLTFCVCMKDGFYEHYTNYVQQDAKVQYFGNVY
jgi:hypothetical protein